MYKPSFFAKFKLNNFIEWRLLYEQPTMQVTPQTRRTSRLPTYSSFLLALLASMKKEIRSAQIRSKSPTTALISIKYFNSKS